MSQTAVADEQEALPLVGTTRGLEPELITTKTNEGAAELAFGVLVIQGTDDEQAAQVDDGTGVPVGVVCRTQYVAPDQYDAGYAQYESMNVMRLGQVCVTAEDGVSPGDQVRVRHGGAGTIGGFLTGAVSGQTVPLNGAEFVGTATAGNKVYLRLVGPLSFGTPDP